jgi:hypothetical protein
MFIASLFTIVKLWNQTRYPITNEQIKKMFPYIHNGVLFTHKEEWNYVTCSKMDGTRDHHVEEKKPDSERQISHFLSYVKSRPKQF